MNIECPHCGGMNNFMTLPRPPRPAGANPLAGQPSEYICLEPVGLSPDGTVRCGVIFKVDLPATRVHRDLYEYELTGPLLDMEFVPRRRPTTVPTNAVGMEAEDHAAALGLEVEDDGLAPVPLVDTLPLALRELAERGVITESQIVDKAGS